MAINEDTGEVVDADQVTDDLDDTSEYYYDESPAARALTAVESAHAPQQPQQPRHTRAEIEALKDTIKAANRDMTDAQFTVFMAAARHLGLDPLARQIVPVFQGGRMTVQTTIDGFRLIAERTRKYRGQIGPFWCGPDGEWRDVWLADGAPAAAKVGVKRSDFDKPMWGVARTKSYAKGGNWGTMPDVMIAKVAESLALRKAFPAELSGAYTAEELDQMTPGEASAPASAPASSQRSTTSRPPTSPTARPAAKPTSRPAGAHASTPTAPRAGATSATAEWQDDLGYNPLADLALMTRFKAVGADTVAKVEAALAKVKAKGEYTRNTIYAYLARVEAIRREQGLLQSDESDEDGADKSVAYDLHDLPEGARAS